MSFSSNDPENSNSSSDPNIADSDSLDNVPEITSTDDEYIPSSDDTPLPAFDPTKTEDEAPLKALVNDLPKLEAVLRNQPPTPPAPPPQHIYQVSSAEPDWSEYSFSPLVADDETELVEEGPSGWQTAWAVLREVGETVILTPG